MTLTRLLLEQLNAEDKHPGRVNVFAQKYGERRGRQGAEVGGANGGGAETRQHLCRAERGDGSHVLRRQLAAYEIFAFGALPLTFSLGRAAGSDAAREKLSHFFTEHIDLESPRLNTNSVHSAQFLGDKTSRTPTARTRGWTSPPPLPRSTAPTAVVEVQHVPADPQANEPTPVAPSAASGTLTTQDITVGANGSGACVAARSSPAAKSCRAKTRG